MTTTRTATANRYYVVRPNGTVERLRSLVDAKVHASNLYDAGVTAPLVVTAPTRDAALEKADRCYAGQITTAQARRAS
jgi:hypothetical protein